MMREHNWADNHTFAAARVHRPTSVDELRRIVAGATHVHAIGARHSFNGVADTPGDLVDLRRIAPGFALDPERRIVTAGAGTDYGELAAWLHEQGWALANMASLPHITLAGAIATGTHGSGDSLGSLSTAVAAMEMVTATGDLVTAHRGDPNFAGMVVSLGALGVVTRVSLDIEPTFDMRQEAFEGLSWDRLGSDIDAVMSAGYSVSVVTSWGGPTVTRLWVKARVADGTPDIISCDHLGISRAASPMPDEIPGLHPFGSVAGPWIERLTHFRRDVEPGLVGHLQSEYFLPRTRAPEAIARLRAIGSRIDRHLLATEIRSILGDTLWLSPAYAQPTIAIHFSWQRHIEEVADLTAEIEAMLLPLGGRPHWGKLIHARHDQLAPLYPQLPAFQDLARAHDPDGKFVNDYLRAHVLGTAADRIARPRAQATGHDDAAPAMSSLDTA